MSTASVREDSRYEASKWDCKDQRTDGSFCAKVESELARADVPKIHVLAVDDSLLERKVIERLLKNSSYEVTTVDSASRALEILGVVDGMSPLVPHAMKINLIITDYCMPGMSGYDLLKRVKQTSGLQEIPVVIMSSENVPNRVKRCLAEGAKEFIIKPVQMADLKRLECHVRKKIFSLNNSESKPSEKLDNSNGTPSMPSKKHQAKRISTDNITFLENSSKRKNVPADLHTQQTSGRRLRLKRTDIGSKPMLEP